jgi:glycosyltransferase involved in cell wall biosynthesis
MFLLELFSKNKIYKKLKKDLLVESKEKNGVSTSLIKIEQLCLKYPSKCIRFKKIFFTIYKDIDTEKSLEIAEEILNEYYDLEFLKVVIARYKNINNYRRAKELSLKFTGKYFLFDELTFSNFGRLMLMLNNKEEIEKSILQLEQSFKDNLNDLYYYIFSYFKDQDLKLAIKYGMIYFENNPEDKKFNLVLLKRLKEDKQILKVGYINNILEEIKYINKILKNYIEFDKQKYISDLPIINKKVTEKILKMFVEKMVNKFPQMGNEIYRQAFIILKNDKKIVSNYFSEKAELNFKEIKIKKKIDKIVKEISISKLLKCQKFNIKLYKKELIIFYDNEILEDWIQEILLKFNEHEEKIYKLIFSELKDKKIDIAVKYGIKYFYLNPNDIKFARVLAMRLERLKEFETLLQMSKKVLETTEDKYFKNIIISSSMQKDFELFNNSSNEVELVKTLENKYENELFYLYRGLFNFYKSNNFKKAELFANKALKEDCNEYIIKDLYDLYITYGHLTKAQNVLSNRDFTINTLNIKKQNIESFLDLYHNGFSLKINKVKDYTFDKNKIFYLLHNRLPYNSGGYATRSHGLLTGATSYGWKMNGVSRLGYPWDKMDIEFEMSDTVDNIQYFTLYDEDIGLGKLPLSEYLTRYYYSLLELAKKEKPEYIHAASNYMNGVVANQVAKTLGIKSIYEVRGLWELTRISRQPEWKDTEYYNLMEKMETQAAKEADIVITITQALKDEMIRRGVSEEKIEILPNGVVSERFEPLSKNILLEEELNIENKIVLGFVGSFVQYEGLEYIVDAVEILVNKGRKDIVALMVGDGTVWQEIRDRVTNKDLDKYFIFTGRIPHDEVEKYYSLVDIAPLPRKGLPVCEMVSPLKPFEAMAMEKVVLSSDVAALAEIIKDGYNGVLFKKDNIEDLAIKIELLMDDSKLREKLGKQAREWVIKERDWKIITKKLNDIYTNLR